MNRYLSLLGALVLAGCAQVGRNGFESPPGEDFRFGNITNGTRCDRAELDLTGIRRIVIPAEAHVVRTGQPGLAIYMQKTLSCAGHGMVMHIEQERKEMGCLVRKEGSSLRIVKFGHWDSRIEGGAYLRLRVEAPDGLRVMRDRPREDPYSSRQTVPAGWELVTGKPVKCD